MPVQPKSAVDCVSPAISCAGRQMFSPIRFGYWNRMAFIGLLTGEAASQGGGFSFPSNWNFPSRHTGSGSGDQWASWLPSHLQGAVHWPARLHDPRILALIAVAAASLVVVMFVWMYFGSVYRFVLFDSVLTGQCSLRKGWHKWNAHGFRFFVWQIGFTVVSLAVFALLAGLGFVIFKEAGFFHSGASAGMIAAGIILGLVFGLLALAVVLVMLVVALLTKDFAVLIMAYENVTATEAWRRLLPMLRSEGGGFTFYVVMKAVLALATSIILGIIDFILVFIVLIPVIIVVVAVGAAGGWHWSPGLIALAVVGGLIVATGLTYVVALVASPTVVFYQSYVLNFFGSRYQPLARVMFPEPQAPPPPPESPPPLPPTDLTPAPVG